MENENVERKEEMSVQSVSFKIALTAMATAFLTIANAYLTIAATPLLQFSVVLTFSFFVGLILGAPLAFVVGFLGDLIGHLLAPKGAYNIIIGISTALFCAIPGLLFDLNRFFKRRGRKGIHFIVIAFASFLLCYALCTVLLTSVGFWIFYNAYSVRNYGTFFGLIVFRMLWQLPNTAANLALSVALYFPLRKIKYFERRL